MITGGTGMVGRNLRESSLNKHTLIAPGRDELDLLDRPQVEAFLRATHPDLIVHCAGRVGGVHANMLNPHLFLSENFTMGHNLVMSAQICGIPNLLNLASSCIYPRDMPRPIREEDLLSAPLEPTNEGYALAKISVLRLCDYITGLNTGFAYKTLIPCNLYGRWDSFDEGKSHMIPAVINKIHDAIAKGLGTVEIWGDGKARREFLYSGDLAAYIATAIDNFEHLPQRMNVGLGYDYSILEYYEAISDVLGFKGKFVFDLSKPVGMNQKLLDITLQESLGFESPTDLRSGIEQTYEFFKMQRTGNHGG
jgi:GDP-L-fucose synthase